MARPRIMLVEGQDDLHAIAHLLTAHGNEGLYHIQAQQGIDPLRANLPVFLKASDLRSLAVVVDADSLASARWQSLRDVLVAHGYDDAPTTLPAVGAVLTSADRPTVGVWLMPDNGTPGTLETFVASIVPEGDTLWTLATEAVARIPAAQRRFSVSAIPKAEVHTWLAWQEDPGMSMGMAIRHRRVDLTRPQAQLFIAWARRLANAGRSTQTPNESV